MKTSKSPDDKEVTPSNKKLKQARLPFKLISEVAPVPGSPQSRKRKLSVPEVEPITKVSKISKENDLDANLVVISDEESKDGQKPPKEAKIANPLVKIVDAARKKKLQKSKSPKRRSNRKKNSKKVSNGTTENDISVDDKCSDVEMVEVDVIIHTEDVQVEDKVDSEETKPDCIKKESPKTPTKLADQLSATITETDEVMSENVCEVVCLEDSNHSSDINSQKSEKETQKKSTTSVDSSSNNVSEVKKEDKTPTKLADQLSATITETDEVMSENECKVVCLEDSNHSSDINSQKSEKETQKKSTTSVDSRSNNVSEVKNEDTKESLQSDKVLKSVTPVTPKRSARNKAKDNDSQKLNSSSSNLDESMTSNQSTPKHNKSLSTPNGDESMNDSTISANLTPKQVQKRLESAKKKEEREKEKQEREIKRQMEKDERAKQRQEKEEQRKRERDEKEEAKKKEKEEKEEQKKKEREEKEKQKELEKKMREMKEEQKRKEKEDKEEQRKKEKEARDEEKRKKQEALELEKQEQELKKKKAKEAFVNFFVPKQKIDKDQTVGPSKNNMLSSFTIKVDMRLAPTIRADLSEEKREILDKFLDVQDAESDLYLKCLKDGTSKPLSCGKTWPLSDKDDVIIVEDELPPIDDDGDIVTCEPAAREKLRPKLLSFHENRRPPYWGTWRKRSAFVKPRRPFGHEKQLDYEVDSDDDWEEEQEGESLDGSACGSDDDDARGDDYEVDNEVFVPHGYLSDEEATMDEDDKDMLSLSPETQKARLKHLEDEFESEMKKPTEKLKPRLYGILWESEDGGKPEKCVDSLWNYFQKFAMILNDPTPLLQPAVEPEDAEKKKVKKKKFVADGEEQSPKTEKKTKSKSERKESKKPKTEAKKVVPNQPGINSFLTKVKST